MRASKSGIEIGKAELTALLTFAGSKEGMDSVRFGVRGRREKLVASATDGKRALEITTESDSDDHVVGEWAVNRAFLEACGHVLESEGLCVLLVTSSGLRKARIMDVESLAERATISWHEEAASTQITIAGLAGIIHNARLLASHTGSWFAVQGRYLADMLVVSKACDKAPITIYPPSGPTDPMYFEATSDSAQWRGVIMPVTVTHPGGLIGEDDEHPDDIGSPERAREALQRAADELGADISMTSFDAEGKTVAKATVKSKAKTDDAPEDAAPLKTEKAPKPKKGSKK
jgi:hypothetical protein